MRRIWRRQMDIGARQSCASEETVKFLDRPRSTYTQVQRHSADSGRFREGCFPTGVFWHRERFRERGTVVPFESLRHFRRRREVQSRGLGSSPCLAWSLL
jgi:hypothetical protein